MKKSLLFALAPKIFFSSYVSTMEMSALQGIPAEQLVSLLANLEEVRMSMFTADAWRSFFIILLDISICCTIFSCNDTTYFD